jgi:hypothetical protein
MRVVILFLSFGLYGYVFAQTDCSPEMQAKKGTYEVRLVLGSVESSAVKPRSLTAEELCMVQEKRHQTEFVTLQLDLYTEVRIFPNTQIEEK